MIDVSRYEKLAECMYGKITWLSHQTTNIVYLMMFGTEGYVGSTRNVHSRFRQYLSALRRGTYESAKVQAAYDRKHGFDLYIIESTTLNDLRKREDYWLKTLRPSLNSRYHASFQDMGGFETRHVPASQLSVSGVLRCPQCGRDVKFVVKEQERGQEPAPFVCSNCKREIKYYLVNI